MGLQTIRLRPTPMIRKQAGQLRKLFGLWDNNSTNRSRVPNINYEPEVKEGTPNFLSHTRGLNQHFVTRRQLVLNRHFTEIVSDVLALKFCNQLSENGVNITSIETKAWNKGVDIFYCTPEPFNMKTHKNLNSLVVELRKSISERRLIGRVPPILFVYDQTIETDRRLSTALEKIDLTQKPETNDLIHVSPQALDVEFDANVTTNYSPYFKPKEFSAPHDMTNDIMGLDYPAIYNKVVANLERGRGESSRMIPTMSLTSSEPLFAGPVQEEDTEEVDPSVRIRNMRRFLIEQKKKYTVQSRYKRKQELFFRDKYKWDIGYEKEDEESNSQDSV